MKPSKVKRLLLEGKVPIGHIVFEFGTTGLSRIAAEAGADYVIYDTEHTGWTLETVRMLAACSAGTDIDAFFRVPVAQYHYIAHALDVGAQGIMVPMVESEEQARHIVESAKYHPMGRRGAAFGVAHDGYASGDILQKMELANAETAIIAIIETVKGVENVEKIAAVDGIDILWIGHFDLSLSMGIPGRFTDPELQASIDRVLRAAKSCGKAVGYMAASAAEARQLVQRGFRTVLYWGDIWLYQQALAEGIRSIRGLEAR